MNTQKFLIDIIKAGEPSTTRLAYYKPDGTNYCYISNAEGTAAMLIFNKKNDT